MQNGSAVQQQQQQQQQHGTSIRDLHVIHQASLTSGSGQLTAEQGLLQLRQKRETSASAGSKCRLLVQPAGLKILDLGTAQLMEEFPLRSIRQPLAYEGDGDNLLLFSVQAQASWEMHIFQLPAAVPANAVAKEIHQLLVSGGGPGAGGVGKGNSAVDGVQNDSTILVKVLNSCLEEVESFALHLVEQLAQRQPKSPRDLAQSPLQQQQSSKKPSIEEFVDVLKKLKLALNLLGRLEGQIHQPNAPELVHCLFTPLALILQVLGGPDVPSRVLSPLFSQPAVELMKHCLTSKESELWYSLGPAWICHRQRWLDEHGSASEVPVYQPRFKAKGGGNTWEPQLDAELLGQAGLAKISSTPQPQTVQMHHEPVNGSGYSLGVKTLNPVTVSQQFSPYSSAGVQRQRPIAQVAPRAPLAPFAASVPSVPASVRRHLGHSAAVSWDDRQERLRLEAQSRGHRVVQAVHDKAGRNAKELTVQRGELLEVLDDSKNWWQLRNCVGEVGHAPYTILRLM